MTSRQKDSLPSHTQTSHVRVISPSSPTSNPDPSLSNTQQMLEIRQTLSSIYLPTYPNQDIAHYLVGLLTPATDGELLPASHFQPTFSNRSRESGQRWLLESTIISLPSPSNGHVPNPNSERSLELERNWPDSLLKPSPETKPPTDDLTCTCRRAR